MKINATAVRKCLKSLASRDHRFDASQSGDPLIQRLEQIAVGLEEEEKITVVDVAGRARAAFDVDKVTKKFYDRFKTEHGDFLELIKGIKATADLEWYTSVMLNRLMFVYFIQKKGFLDGDADYLRNRLAMVRKARGNDRFHSFYRYFLLRLFHEGLGKAPGDRKLDAAMEKLLGKVPFLNGWFFEVHELEEQNPEIDIPDKAFEKLFDFFDQYSWHLDERPLRADNEINPDVVGYIFEKYINQKQMGAYYTKEDITEYIGKSTIIPFLFDAAKKKCEVAFKPESALWRLLRDDPDRYLYAAVRHGVIDAKGSVIPLPKEIEAGVKDVAKRHGWNKPAPDPYGLPTETWREHVTRRTRCLEMRQKLKAGEVHAINELVTLNVDIWQFARDAIVNSEGPELLRAFWHAIEKVTVLDPTCGSGAFLFAGLRILETLYGDCLERMERFIEDLVGKPHHPEQFSDFRTVLEQIAKHPNDHYFILKSIIINNLFGVDIMEEAVEICKLRLFLKLVAQVETVGQIEPLPDIDFNIRAGNTLVGYVSLDQVRTSQKGTLGFGDAIIKRIEEDAELVERAFQQFRTQQTIHGGRVSRKDKLELRRRLEKLDSELDRYLAGEYGIDAEKRKDAFSQWRDTHQPFHWFVEFFGIMRGGGFDVIIGNPPYVNMRKILYSVAPMRYQSALAGDLFALTIEQTLRLVRVRGHLGLIVPLSATSTATMRPLRNVLATETDAIWASYYSASDQPASLFTGVRHRLCILIGRRGKVSSCALHTTRFMKWFSDERPVLFQACIAYANTPSSGPLAFPKVSSSEELALLTRLGAIDTLGAATTKNGHRVYYHNAPVHWGKVFDFVPMYRVDGGESVRSSHLKDLCFKTKEEAAFAICLLNSSLFYWFNWHFSNCRDLSSADVERAPAGLKGTKPSDIGQFAGLCKDLMEDYRKHRKLYKRVSNDVTTEFDSFYPMLSKPLLDRIDKALAKHFGMTSSELEYVIHYDLKYRFGKNASEEDDD